jgi:asparagine synthase (glutamine-hydrolysing)
MQHRGPDDFGEWWSPDGRVGLGHRRLAVIDLTAGGHQPMLDAASDLVITFNGEIYNYRDLRRQLSASGHAFRSESDTEVVLAAFREWGRECVLRLDGMFSIALYDRRADQLFLARDRAGEKPLFYADAGDRLLFASELKALMAYDPALRRADLEALDCYLGMGYVPGDRCILSGVKKLPPAHALVFDVGAGTTKVWRYWQPPACVNDAPDVDELVSGLADVMNTAIEKQLVADVPIGVLLSGGLDSSLITAIAATKVSRLKTFTVTFPGSPRHDESAHARVIADRFGTEHIELPAAEISPSLLPALARQYDEPVIDTSMIPTFLVSQLVRRHCTVALGGDGGDELFGGYDHYRRLSVLDGLSRYVPSRVRRGLGAAAVALAPTAMKGRNWLAALAADLHHTVPLVASYFDRDSRLRLLPGLDAVAGACENVWAERVSPGGDLVDRATRTDFANYLPETILVKVDRASMLNSLEVRAPFLDRSVLEFAFGRVPAHLKATKARQKILLKTLAARVLPMRTELERKQGFTVPIAEWLLAGPWQRAFQTVLLDGSTMFRRDEVERLWSARTRGHRNTEGLFGLLMLELWRREYGVTVG